MEGDAVEGLVVCVSREQVLLQPLDERQTGRAHGPSKVSLELTGLFKGVM